MTTTKNENETQATVLNQRAAITAAPTGAFDVVVVEGPDKGARITVDGSQEGPSLVGKSSVCQLKLTDALVSRRHISLEAVGRGLRVIDLDSTNGTLTGTLKITDAVFSGGETIKLGDTTLSIERKKTAGTPPILPPASSFGKVLGMSREMRRLYPLFERLALKTNMSVLIEGETGSGKEVLAESLHAMGPRAKGPFVVFDCTTATPTGATLDLFGDEARPGVFEKANGGTLLLDEIGDLDASLQPKLLRVLERGEVQRGGTGEPIKVDVRILSATRRDLDREVQEGRFREDLFHRLVVTRVEMPPLRMRKGDVTILAKHFARELGGEDAASLPSDLLARWEDQNWPGNVRGLRNAVARELALGGLQTAEYAAVDEEQAPTPEETAKAIADAGPPSQPLPEVSGLIENILSKRLSLLEARQRIVEEFDRAYLTLALAESGGNVTRAAAISGLARRNFQILRTRRGV